MQQAVDRGSNVRYSAVEEVETGAGAYLLGKGSLARAVQGAQYLLHYSTNVVGHQGSQVGGKQ